MENNLDKYFKDNLHDRQFEMKEEYWLGAEKLLDAQDKRRKRRVIFWWFGAGLGVMLFLASGYWFLNKKSGEKAATVTSEITKQPSEISGVNAMNSEDGKVGNAANMKPLSSGEELESTTTSTAENSITNQKSNNQIKRQPSDNQQITNNSTRSLFSIKPKNIKPDSFSNSSVDSEQTTKKQSKDAAQEPLEIQQQLAETQESVERISTPEGIDVLMCFVKGNFSRNDLRVAVVEERKPTEPVKKAKFHVGIMASQMLQTSPDTGEMLRLGNKIGLAFHYDLKGGFYLASGLQYQRRIGHFEATKLAEQRNYRFGLELDTILLRPNSLHYLSIPVLLGWKQNRHHLEGGLLMEYLTGVHGESGSYQKQGEPPVKKFTVDEKGWLSKDGYRQVIPTAQLNYHYRIGRMWSLGLSANYSFGGILDDGYQAPLGGFLLKESNKFYLGLQAVYFLN